MGKKAKTKGKGKAAQGRSLPQKQSRQDEVPKEQFIPLQDRIASVKPFWREISEADRKDILMVKVSDLIERAEMETEKQRRQAAMEESLFPEDTITIDLEPTPSETLQVGLDRLKSKSTWKLWQWPEHEQDFLDAESFRTFVETERMSDAMRSMLPRDDGKPIERPAEAQLRERMSDLLQRVHNYNRNLQDQEMNGSRKSRGQRATADQVNASIRDANIELIMMMMAEFEKENEHLYRSVMFPITKAICELLDPQQRDSKCNDLSYEDFDKMHPDDVARFCEWLTEKVDGYSSKIKLEAKDLEEEDQEEGIGDVDLFTLVDDPEKGKCLVVNAKWLQHLQDRVLGEDGQPRKMKEGEDPDHIGLVLEWVYGTIVSTAEKARDGAKRLLGTSPPTVHMAFDMLDAALKEQKMWEEKRVSAKEMATRLMESRKEARDHAKIHPDLYAPRQPLLPEANGDSHNLPDEVILFMLGREVLLTEAKMMTIDFEKYKYDRELRSLKVQMRQGEPEFERLKKEMDDLKQTHRKMDGPFRTTHEMERHQTQAQDAQVEEQIQVQTQFREHSAKLQSIFDKRQRVEVDITRKVSEERQLIGWKDTVKKLIDKFDELTLGPSTPPNGKEQSIDSQLENGEADEETYINHRALMNAARNTSGQEAGLQKLRSHFQKDVRRQFYTDEDDRAFFGAISSEIKTIDKIIDDGRAVLQLLEMHLVNVACNDPGAVIGNQLILPMLQERLDEEVRKAAERNAQKAELDIIRMEEEHRQKEQLEREKKQKKKQKAEDKARSEKERLEAEQNKRQEAEKVLAEEQNRRIQEEADKIRQEKEREENEKRKVIEEAMEARRKELGLDSVELLQQWDESAKSLDLESPNPPQPRATSSEESSDGASKSHENLEDDEGFRQHTGSRHHRKPRTQKPPEETLPPPGFYERPAPKRDFRDGGRHRRPNPHEGRTLPIRPRVLSVDRQTLHPATNTPRPDPSEAHHPGTPPRSEPEKPQAGPSQRPKSAHEASPSHRSQSSSETSESQPQSQQGSKHVDQTRIQSLDSAQPSHEISTQSEGQNNQNLTTGAANAPVPSTEAPSIQIESSHPSEDISHKTEDAVQPVDSHAKIQEADGDVSFVSSVSPNTPQQPILPSSTEPPSGGPPLTHSPLPNQHEGTVVYEFQPDANKAPSLAPSEVPQHSSSGPHQNYPLTYGGTSQAPPYTSSDMTGYGGQYRSREAPPFVPPAANSSQRFHPGSQIRRPQSGYARHPDPYASGYGPPPQAVIMQRMARSQQAQPSGPIPIPGQALSQPNPEAMAMLPLYPAPNMPPYGPPNGHVVEGPGQGHHARMPSQQMLNFGPQAHPSGFIMSAGPPIQNRGYPSQYPQGLPLGPSTFRQGSHGVEFIPHPGPQQSPQPGQLVMQRSGEIFRGELKSRSSDGQTRHLPTENTPREGLSRKTSVSSTGLPKSNSLRHDAPSFVPSSLGRQLSADPAQIAHAGSQGSQKLPTSLSPSAPAFELYQSSPKPSPPPPQIIDRPSQPAHIKQVVTPMRGEVESAKPQQGIQPSIKTSFSASETREPTGRAELQGEYLENSPSSSDAKPPGTRGFREDLITQHSPPVSKQSNGHSSSQSNGHSPGHHEASSSSEASPTKSNASSQTKGSMNWSAVAAQANALPKRHSKGDLRSDSPTRSKNKRTTPSPRNLSSSSLKQQADTEQIRDPESRLRKTSIAPQKSLENSPRTSLTPSQKQPGSSSAGDKEFVQGGVRWRNMSHDECDRLSMARGLDNKTGTNNCFLNVVIQSLWHLQAFREQFLKIDIQAASSRGAAEADFDTLNALQRVLSGFVAMREASKQGEGSEAKRIKLEGQNAASSSSELFLSPRLLRDALSRMSSAFSESTMNDASELCQLLLESLHVADAGSGATKWSSEAAKQHQIPVNTLHSTTEGSHSTIRSIFVQEIQAPNKANRDRPGDESEAQILPSKRSRGTGGAKVDRWQDIPSRKDVPSRPQKPQSQQAKPNLQQNSESQKGIMEIFRYPQLMHQINAQNYVDLPRSEDILLNTPQIFIQAIGWEALHASTGAHTSLIKSLRAQLDAKDFFQSCPDDAVFTLQAIIAFYGHHYQAFVYSFELTAWLLINDLEITKIGTFGDVKKVLSDSRLQPNVLFYERA